MTRQDFMKGIAFLEMAIGKSFDENRFEVFYTLLQDIEGDKFLNGIQRLLNERVYTNIPAPAEIRQYCTGTKDGDIENRIQIAKDQFEKIIYKVSAYMTIGIADPYLCKIIDTLGGWIKAKQMTVDEIDNFLKFEFAKTYKAYLKTGDIGEMKTVLVGISDAQNNIDNPEPKIFIGGEDNWRKMHNAYQSRLADGSIKKTISEFSGVKKIEVL